MARFSAGAMASASGMQTNVWGPSMWFFLHTMSANFPVNPTMMQRQHHVAFLLSLAAVLPCRHCRNNFEANLKTALAGLRPGRRVAADKHHAKGKAARAHYNRRLWAVRAGRAGGTASKYKFHLSPLHPAFDGREVFFELVWRLHCAVTQAIRGDEPYRGPSLAAARDTYESFRSRCNTPRERRKIVGEQGCTEPVEGHIKGHCTIRVVDHAVAPVHVIEDTRGQCKVPVRGAARMNPKGVRLA